MVEIKVFSEADFFFLKTFTSLVCNEYKMLILWGNMVCFLCVMLLLLNKEFKL